MFGGALSEDVEARIRRTRVVAFDFDGVFTDNSVLVDQDGRELVRCSRFDGLGLRRLEERGVRPLVISTEVHPVVTARCRKLKIECHQSCEDKWATLERVLAEARVRPEEAAFVGNDVNDAPCLRQVGLPIVVQDAHPAVVPLARWRTERPGGHGAVREICDQFDRVLSAAGT